MASVFVSVEPSSRYANERELIKLFAQDHSQIFAVNYTLYNRNGQKKVILFHVQTQVRALA